MTRGAGRRDLLAALGGLAGTGLAGCVGAPLAGDGDRDRPVDGDRTTGYVDTEIARHGVPPTICEESIREDPGIHAVVDPVFGDDWSDREVDGLYGPLTGDSPVVGVERGGQARAYPVSVLTHHEIANVEHGGPLLVTFCPLCNSGLVAERLVGGEPTSFHVSGLLWRAPQLQSEAAERRGDVFGVGVLDPDEPLHNGGNLVMYDARTRSYWSQILARAICGPRNGDTLTAVPATTTTWDEWRVAHPATRVLLPPPYSGTDEPD